MLGACNDWEHVEKGCIVTRARTHVGVEVGDGLVARFGDALVLVAEPGRYPQGTEQLLEAVESMASEDSSPGVRIAVGLAAIIAGPEPGAVPPFGVVAPMEGAYVVLLHGPVWVEITARAASSGSRASRR